ncbi:MAG: hypothetical protein LBM66_01550 [Bifidobacteriaceae bacterium]|jgi:predicted nucleic acid-binding protein|nr:hypothetical protein [Bifidobacteriaceae bacterium]
MPPNSLPAPLTIFVDANVLFSRTLRDWTIMLSLEDGAPFNLHTSEDVLAEVCYRYRRKRPTAPGRLIAAIRSRIVDSLGGLVTDYTPDPSNRPTDLNDLHVHAAACVCAADFVLTDDRAFETWALAPGSDTPYQPIRPDLFFMWMLTCFPGIVVSVYGQQLAYWAQREPVPDLPARLRQAGCPRFATQLNRLSATPQ